MEKVMNQCVDEAFAERSSLVEQGLYGVQDDSRVREPVVGKQHKVGGRETRLVEVEAALTEEEAFAVQALAGCVRRHFPDYFEDRTFEGNDNGGNHCTYLAHFMQLFAPGVAAHITKVAHLAWVAAGWDREYPDPRMLGLRTAEHLRYEGGGKLGSHTDADSFFTVLVFLTDPQDYKGGEFILEHGGEVAVLKGPRLSALVFLSETSHLVTPITGGGRETFATEFWRFDDVVLGHTRPSPEDWVEFIEKVDVSIEEEPEL